jgi:hypothetical protein
LTGTEPTTGRGWPTYLAWRASRVKAQLHDEEIETRVNPDGLRMNIGLDPLDQRLNRLFPRDPFLNQNPLEQQPPMLPRIPPNSPRPPGGLPKL